MFIDDVGLDPGKGNVAEPGLSFVSAGKGVINGCPVSVCHHVSITGQRPPPMFCDTRPMLPD